MGFPILVRWHLYIESTPWLLQLVWDQDPFVSKSLACGRCICNHTPPILVRWHLYIESAPWLLQLVWDQDPFVSKSLACGRCICNHTPPLQRSWKGGILVSPCPSVCPSVDRIVSALYLQQYSSDPFHISTSYQAPSKGVLHVMFVSKFKKFVILANSLNL